MQLDRFTSLPTDPQTWTALTSTLRSHLLINIHPLTLCITLFLKKKTRFTKSCRLEVSLIIYSPVPEEVLKGSRLPCQYCRLLSRNVNNWLDCQGLVTK